MLFIKKLNIFAVNTNAGYAVGSGFTSVKELCANSNVLEGFSIKDEIEKDGILFVLKCDEQNKQKPKYQIFSSRKSL